MTSIIKVDEIQNKAGTTTLDADKLPDMHTGSAKLYLNFDMQASNVINSSFNVSSCTDHATATFTCSYTNNMSDALYSCVASVRDGSGENDTRIITGSVDVAYYTSSSSRWVSGTHSSTASALTKNDPYMAFLQIHGDLA